MHDVDPTPYEYESETNPHWLLVVIFLPFIMVYISLAWAEMQLTRAMFPGNKNVPKHIRDYIP